MKTSDLPGIKHLIGSDVRVTVVWDIRGCKYDPVVFEGRLMAIGRKQGPSPQNTMPYCLVIDASATGGGVPIIAIRSITSVEPVPVSEPTSEGGSR